MGQIFGSGRLRIDAERIKRFAVVSEFKPDGGIFDASFEALRWPHPVHPGDELRVQTEVLDTRPSKSRPEMGFAKVKVTTLNQAGETVQLYVANLVVLRRAKV